MGGLNRDSDANALANIKADERMYRDGFETLLRRQGWHMSHCKPLFTDPQVACIRKARHPLSLERGPGAWHTLLGNNTFRKLLRALMSKARTLQDLQKICTDSLRLNWYLSMLEDGGLITRESDIWKRGAEAQSIDNMGATLEWYIAEWFRSELHAPARHGVILKEVPRGGDLDVIAFVGDVRVFVECKTSRPSSISETELRWFLQRASDFSPEIALLYIDTDDPLDRPIEKLNRIINELAWKDARLHNPNLTDNASLRTPIIELQPSFENIYWGARRIYVTGTFHNTIDDSLSAVLRLYHSKVRYLTFFSGDMIWDYVTGEVKPAK